MIHCLDDVETFINEIKENENTVYDVNVYLQEKEDGWNTHVDVAWGSPYSGDTFTLGREESRHQAEERAKNLVENISKIHDKVNLFTNIEAYYDYGRENY